MKFTAWKLGYTIVEIPIIFTDRELVLKDVGRGIQ